MRLRNLFALLLGLSIALGMAALLATWAAERATDEAARLQVHAQETLREARGLLVLTKELVLHGNERAARQWHLRYATLKAAVVATGGVALSAAPDLHDELRSLPELFDKLAASGVAPHDDPSAQRHRELLIEGMVADIQAILDQVYAWGTAMGARRSASEGRLALLAVVDPALLVLVLGSVGWTLSRRVLQPLRELRDAMTRVEGGDLAVRRASDAGDEVGDLACRFDRLTASLQAAVHARADDELRLRTITDNLSVRIAYIDLEQRYRFANPACCFALSADAPEELLGRTLRDVSGEARHREIEPDVVAALGGERRSFVRTDTERGRLRHNEYALLPHRDALGAVRGYYAMVHDITEHHDAQARVEAALHEKEVLLKEVHHRVKNNMQVISSLLQLQVGYVANEEAQQLLAESQDRIQSMALVHEKLYQSNDFAQVDFADYVHSLVPMLAASHEERAAVEVRAEPIWINIEQAIPAGLVLNELVSNSFKHGFPPGRVGRIEVSFLAEGEDRVRLRVSDDGVGPPPGFDPAASATLGLRLVHILAEQLDAVLTIGHASGFACELVFARPARLITGAAHA